MNYAEARQFLDRFPRFEVKPGLRRIQALVEALDHPHLAYPTIHVGGTNGKGSVVAMLDSVLRCAGFRVGRFTSPELIDFRDRIAVNGDWISEDEFAQVVTRMAPFVAALEEAPSQFEIITVVAFDHLACAGIDIGVIEVGLGGRFDATNVVRPELAVLTSVALDHQAILGDTVEAIAWEKAGIATANTPLLVGDLPASVSKVVSAECDRVGAILAAVSGIDVTRRTRDWETAVYQVRGAGDICEIVLPLIGSAQEGNLRLVLGAIRELRLRGFEISDEAIVQGLRSVQWPGRLEVVRTQPRIVLDGAHNPAAIRALVADVVDLVPNPKHRSLLYGTLLDKDVDTSLAILGDVFPGIGVCASQSPRALPVDRLSEQAGEYFQNIVRYHSVVDGIGAWLSHAGAEDVLVVSGSLTVVAEARRWLIGET